MSAHRRLNLLTKRVVRSANDTNLAPVINERTPVEKVGGEKTPRKIAGARKRLSQYWLRSEGLPVLKVSYTVMPIKTKASERINFKILSPLPQIA